MKFDNSAYVKRLEFVSADKETDYHFEEINSGGWKKEPTRYESTRSSVMKSARTYEPRCKIDRDTEHRMKLADRARTPANEVRADKAKAFNKCEWAQLKRDFDSMYRHCLIQNAKRGVDFLMIR